MSQLANGPWVETIETPPYCEERYYRARCAITFRVRSSKLIPGDRLSDADYRVAWRWLNRWCQRRGFLSGERIEVVPNIFVNPPDRFERYVTCLAWAIKYPPTPIDRRWIDLSPYVNLPSGG